MRLIFKVIIFVITSVQLIKSTPTRLEKIQEWIAGMVDECIESTGVNKEEITNFFDSKPGNSTEEKCLKSCLLIHFGVMNEDTAEFNEEGVNDIFNLMKQFNNEELTTQKEIYNICSKQVEDEQDQCEKAEKYRNCSVTEAEKLGSAADYIMFDISDSIRTSWIKQLRLQHGKFETVQYFINECLEITNANTFDLLSLLKWRPAVSTEGKCLKSCFIIHLDLMQEDTLKINKEASQKWFKFQTQNSSEKNAINEYCIELVMFEKDKCEKAERYLNCISNEVKDSSDSDKEQLSVENDDPPFDLYVLNQCLTEKNVTVGDEEIQRIKKLKPAIGREGKCLKACVWIQKKRVNPYSAEIIEEGYYKWTVGKNTSANEKLIVIAKEAFKTCNESLLYEKDVCEKVEKFMNCVAVEFAQTDHGVNPILTRYFDKALSTKDN